MNVLSGKFNAAAASSYNDDESLKHNETTLSDSASSASIDSSASSSSSSSSPVSSDENAREGDNAKLKQSTETKKQSQSNRFNKHNNKKQFAHEHRSHHNGNEPILMNQQHQQHQQQQQLFLHPAHFAMYHQQQQHQPILQLKQGAIIPPTQAQSQPYAPQYPPHLMHYYYAQTAALATPNPPSVATCAPNPATSVAANNGNTTNNEWTPHAMAYATANEYAVDPVTAMTAYLNATQGPQQLTNAQRPYNHLYNYPFVPPPPPQYATFGFLPNSGAQLNGLTISTSTAGTTNGATSQDPKSSNSKKSSKSAKATTQSSSASSPSSASSAFSWANESPGQKSKQQQASNISTKPPISQKASAKSKPNGHNKQKSNNTTTSTNNYSDLIRPEFLYSTDDPFSYYYMSNNFVNDFMDLNMNPTSQMKPFYNGDYYPAANKKNMQNAKHHNNYHNRHYQSNKQQIYRHKQQQPTESTNDAHETMDTQFAEAAKEFRDTKYQLNKEIEQFNKDINNYLSNKQQPTTESINNGQPMTFHLNDYKVHQSDENNQKENTNESEQMLANLENSLLEPTMASINLIDSKLLKDNDYFIYKSKPFKPNHYHHNHRHHNYQPRNYENFYDNYNLLGDFSNAESYNDYAAKMYDNTNKFDNHKSRETTRYGNHNSNNNGGGRFKKYGKHQQHANNWSASASIEKSRASNRYEQGDDSKTREKNAQITSMGKGGDNQQSKQMKRKNNRNHPQPSQPTIMSFLTKTDKESLFEKNSMQVSSDEKEIDEKMKNNNSLPDGETTKVDNTRNDDDEEVSTSNKFCNYQLDYIEKKSQAAKASRGHHYHEESQTRSSLIIPAPIVDLNVEKARLVAKYNPKEFNTSPKQARFFVIKSYSEDDIHRSIKYGLWCSTEHGNRRLDLAFKKGLNHQGQHTQQQQQLENEPNEHIRVPVFLFFSVNGSGHFCGMAQMMSSVDYNSKALIWAQQDKWRGCFQVNWIYVKDIPNSILRNIRLENNDNKPVTNSRDTQEIPFDKGKQVLKIFHTYNHSSSIFDDFEHYEKKQLQLTQEEEENKEARAGMNDMAQPPTTATISMTTSYSVATNSIVASDATDWKYMKKMSSSLSSSATNSMVDNRQHNRHYNSNNNNSNNHHSNKINPKINSKHQHSERAKTAQQQQQHREVVKEPEINLNSDMFPSLEASMSMVLKAKETGKKTQSKKPSKTKKKADESDETNHQGEEEEESN